MKTYNPRTAYGEALAEMAGENKNVVALDADLCKSTMSVKLQEKFPERFFEVGIAEQNMAATAAGLAIAGKIPFIHSFAVFSSGRAFDQIRQAVCVPGLNVKIVGSSTGLSDFGDGATHQSVEDMAIMRAIPNMTVLSPGDPVEVKKAVRAAVNHDGPVYLRISRSDMPVIFDESMPFEIGKNTKIREGNDAAVFATGFMVAKALEAAEKLAQEGISAKVINVSTIKPLDEEGIVRESRGMKCVVTAEEHNVIGGLGQAVASALRLEKVPVEFVAVQDTFGISAMDHEELLEYYGLTACSIASAVKKLIK